MSIFWKFKWKKNTSVLSATPPQKWQKLPHYLHMWHLNHNLYTYKSFFMSILQKKPCHKNSLWIYLKNRAPTIATTHHISPKLALVATSKNVFVITEFNFQSFYLSSTQVRLKRQTTGRDVYRKHFSIVQITRQTYRTLQKKKILCTNAHAVLYTSTSFFERTEVNLWLQ
jgi:hypothetical protein